MKISIIIPFFNTREKYLDQLFSLIRKSSCDNFEFVFVDDGSNAKISSIVKKHCESNGYRFYRFDLNSGVSNARNKGIELASYNRIMFLDSDDIIDFSFLNNYEWNEKTDLTMFTDNIFRDTVVIPLNQKPVMMSHIKDDISVLYLKNSDRLNLRSACCKILRKDLISKYNLKFDTKLPFYEDAFFMTSYYSHISNFEAYSNVLYYYRIYGTSSSKKHNKNYIDKYQLYFNKYLESFHNNTNYIYALYKDTFCSVLINKFTRSIKACHFLFAYKLLRAEFLKSCLDYIINTFSKNSFEHKLALKLSEEKYLSSYCSLLTHRFLLSFRARIKRHFR